MYYSLMNIYLISWLKNKQNHYTLQNKEKKKFKDLIKRSAEFCIITNQLKIFDS